MNFLFRALKARLEFKLQDFTRWVFLLNHKRQVNALKGRAEILQGSNDRGDYIKSLEILNALRALGLL